jgi:hypothetical protein
MVYEEVIQAWCLEHALQDRVPVGEIKISRNLHETSVANISQAGWRSHGPTGSLRLNHATTATSQVAAYRGKSIDSAV